MILAEHNMKSTFLLPLASLFLMVSAFAVPPKVARPDFENASGPLEGGGVMVLQGNIDRLTGGPTFGSGADATYLSQSRYGHPFAVTQISSPNSTFAEEVLRNNGGTGVYDVLYPAGYRTATGVTATRSELTDPATGGAFRYRWLMYGEGGADDDGNPVILNLFAETFQDTSDDDNPWYGDDERMAAMDQIDVLRDALSMAPLNRELQFALLDIYYDLAVAEMQFVNKRLAKLATIRLGLDSSANEFIIDREIALYRELIQVVGQAAAWYSELLCFEMAGVEPGDFVSDFQGRPYGNFIFVSRVPGRSQSATELGYASATPRIFTAVGGVATIMLPGANNDFTITTTLPAFPDNFRVVMSEGGTLPSAGADTLSIPVVTGFTKISEIKAMVEMIDPGDFTVTFSAGNDGTGTASTGSGAVEQIIELSSETEVVFAGYKDYRTFLTILGQLVQFKTDLARLLGMRSASGDITEARQLIAEVQGPDTNLYLQLKGLFADTDFDSTSLDSTGVRSAFTLVSTALSESIGVRNFVNGTANMLGLDPDFLLIVEKQPGETDGSGAELFDSYDILKNRIKAPTGALQVALDRLGDPNNPGSGGGAIQSYATFLTGVSQTTGDLLDLEIALRDRFEEITGFPWDDGVNGWDGTKPKSDVIGSDLATADRTIAGLIQQNSGLKQVLSKAETDVRNAQAAVGLANGIKDSIKNAQSSYLTKTDDIYGDLAISQGLAAAAQVAYDSAAAIAGLTPSPLAFGPGATIATAGGINGIAQGTAAGFAVTSEKGIDKAAIQYQTKLALADQALTVQQSIMEIGALQREVLATDLQTKSNISAIAQAIADRAALIREVARIEDNFRAKRADLASAYFADPIHFQRAEAALLIADASFRRAQWWLFMTARALEYKWQERFAYANPQIRLAVDIGTIFSARNALELDAIFQAMAFFNEDRLTSPGTLRQDTATVSLRDRVLTPNPADTNKEFGAFPPDDGLRTDSDGNPITKEAHFHALLSGLAVSAAPGGGFNPAISIPVDTSQLEIGQLFAGPTYTYSPSNPDQLISISSGLYRDKIDWLAVHFVFKAGSFVNGNAVPSLPGNNGINGNMIYSGNTFFRTRVPPLPDRSPVELVNANDAKIASDESAGLQIDRRDYSGEFVPTPFRYFQNTNPAVFVFETFGVKDATSLEYIFSTQSAETPAVEAEIQSNSGFQINDFKELSVATTGLLLNIEANQFRIEDLVDIELVVQHRAYTRPQIKVTAP